MNPRHLSIIRKFLRVGALCAATFLAVEAQASIVISDPFTTPDPGVMLGRTPQTTDLPGGTYSAKGNYAFYNSLNANPVVGGVATVQADLGWAILLGATYNTNATISIQASINLGSLASATGYNTYEARVAGLGFYTNNGATAGGATGFVGLSLAPDGALRLIDASASLVGSVAYTGTWNASVAHLLSYDVNTATGAISNVSLSGSTSTYAYTTALFTSAATTYAGFYGAGDAIAQAGSLDNFQVSSTGPEPSTWVLAAAGLTVVAALRRRRMQP